jgi:PPM family protein phosphatase
MGGHAAGEVASRLAVEVVARVYYDHAGEPQPALSEALVAANHAIYAAARRDASLHGMGTTCTALALRQGAAFLAHVGDSRLYLVRGGEIYQLSEDHSAVAEMLRRGLLSAQEAREHAERNVILRALGTHAEVNVTTWEQGFPVRAGDCFLLCSDGLSDLVADEEIRHAVESAEAAQSCARLIALARERGGHDNITVALLSLGRSTTEWHSLKSVPIDHQGAQPEVCAAVEWKVAR